MLLDEQDVPVQPDSSLTGVILTGGESSRFGSNKSSFVIEGRSMLERVYDALAPAVSSIVLSGKRKEDLLPQINIISDIFLGKGPLAGLHASMIYCNTPWILVAAVDLPFITTLYVEQLARERTVSSVAVVARTRSGVVQPLFGCYSKTLVKAIEKRLRAGQLSMKAFLATLDQVNYVEMPEQVLRNINTRDDLKH